MELQTGLQVQDPMTKTKNYIFREGGARQYDTTPVPSDDNWDLPQFKIISKLGGRGIPHVAVKGLIERTARVQGTLSEIPKDASLLEVTPPWDALATLFEAILDPKIEQLGLARTTKILHRYRPHLIPILDAKLLRKYYEPAALARGQNLSDKSPEAALERVKLLKIDADKHREILEQIAAETGLTPLRVLDVLLWVET